MGTAVDEQHMDGAGGLKDMWKRLAACGVSDQNRKYSLDLVSLDLDKPQVTAAHFVQICVAMEHFVEEDKKLRTTLELRDMNTNLDNMVIHLTKTCQLFSNVIRLLGPQSASRFLQDVLERSYFAQELNVLGPETRSQIFQDWIRNHDSDTNEIIDYIHSYTEWQFTKQIRRTKACTWRKINYLDDTFSADTVALNVNIRKAVQIGKIIIHLLEKQANDKVSASYQTLHVIPECREHMS